MLSLAVEWLLDGNQILVTPSILCVGRKYPILLKALYFSNDPYVWETIPPNRCWHDRHPLCNPLSLWAVLSQLDCAKQFNLDDPLCPRPIQLIRDSISTPTFVIEPYPDPRIFCHQRPVNDHEQWRHSGPAWDQIWSVTAPVSLSQQLERKCYVLPWDMAAGSCCVTPRPVRRNQICVWCPCSRPCRGLLHRLPSRFSAFGNHYIPGPIMNKAILSLSLSSASSYLSDWIIYLPLPCRTCWNVCCKFAHVKRFAHLKAQKKLSPRYL